MIRPPAPEALGRVTLRMTSALRVEEVLPAITGGLVADFSMALARIWLAMPDRQCPLCVSRGKTSEEVGLHLVASDGLHRAVDGSYHRVEIGALKIGAIAASREPLVSEPVAGDPRIPDQAWVAEHGLRSFAGFPLLFQDQLLGVLGIFAARHLVGDELEWLGIFARQAAIAIHTARLFSAAERANLVLRAQNEALRHDVPSELPELIGESDALRRLRAEVGRLAPAEVPVLIVGETGTGKSHLATTLHALSPRREKALLRVDCATADPASLLGEERLGPGQRLRLGTIELAEGGVVLLHEVAELSMPLQGHLLRLLDSGTLTRVGGSRAISADVRVLATTRHDLRARVAEGRFREDLFYRLSAAVLSVPPLRNRLEDIPALAQEFLRRAADRLRRPGSVLDPDAIDRLRRYDWPGNVRELRNVIERAVILSDSRVVELPESALAPLPLPTLDDVQREHIRTVLARTGGRIEGPRGAARVLGLHPNTLRSRMARLGLR
jgi:transcriptional regulator with GAF, ATPase, and Fis domain